MTIKPELLARYASTIEKAEKALGQLTFGQRSDLLLDNHSEILNSTESRQIVNAIQETTK